MSCVAFVEEEGEGWKEGRRVVETRLQKKRSAIYRESSRTQPQLEGLD